jgi:hypothetical protein
MTSKRFGLIAAALVSAAVAAASGCGSGGTPCKSCPPIEGRYPLTFAAGTVPANCTSLGVALPRGPLDIQRAGGQLTASLDEVELQGSVYQTLEFTLLGTQATLDGGTTQFSLNGTYTPGHPDGGTGQIAGSFTGTYSRGSAQGASNCTLFRAYTAAQQGQP